MPVYIATFGQKHKELKDKFVRITAEDVDAAHCVLYQNYGNRWSMLYETEKQAGIKQFNLELLEEIQ